jgi:hypothetical protein
VVITVRYEDEDCPITYLSERDRKLIEAVKFMWGISVREVCEMARGIILREMDPIQADGAVFEFVEAAPGSMPDFCWISPAVPEPNARVDLLEAWDVAQRDARACRATLECDGSMEALIRVYANSIKWMRFWSTRFPNAEWRARFAQELEAREEGLAELRFKAFSKGNLEMIEKLTNV